MERREHLQELIDNWRNGVGDGGIQGDAFLQWIDALETENKRLLERSVAKDYVLSALWRSFGAMPPNPDALAAMDDIMQVVDELQTTAKPLDGIG